MDFKKELEQMKEECVSSELIFDGRVLHLYRDVIRLPNGEKGMREYNRHIGAICVLPLDAEENVYCVRQYRYPVAEVLTEIPAGKLDSKTEDRPTAALRELREETGFRADKLTDLGDFYPSPAICDERISMYLAEDLTAGETDFDDDEFLSVVKIPLSELVEQVQAGKIPDAKTQMAVMRVADLLRRRKERRA